MYFTLSWDPISKQLITEKSYEDVAEKAARDSQSGDRCHIDPTGRFMTLELYEGVINVVPIARDSKRKQATKPVGTLCDPIPTRIPELFVRSSAFLNRRKESDKPQIALLYEDSQQKVRLKLRELAYTPGLNKDIGNAEFENEIEVKDEIELGASHIIPLGAPAYGFLVVGETSISYCDEFKHSLITEPLDEATIFVAWEQIDDQRFVLADDYGRLYLLMVMLNRKQDFEGWQLDLLGETSRASTLVYLDGGRIFVGSHQGNSQVIQIAEQSMEIVQTFPNVAPILDFAVMDMGNRTSEAQVNEYSSGQARIVTGSGAFKDGSLRSVRSGVGLEDLGSLGEMQHVTDVFGLKISATAEFASALIVSFITHTRAFVFSGDGQVEEVESFKGLDMSQPTILAENLSNGHMVQVTSSKVTLFDSEGGMVVGTWSPEGSSQIVAASAAHDQILLSISGVGVVLLSASGQQLQVKASRTFDASSQVACIALSTFLPNVCLVGFWQGSAVSLLSLEDLQTVHSEMVLEEGLAVPRSLLVAQVLPEASPTLFVGMADGNVVTYSIDPKINTLSGRKSIILGTQQANFRSIPRGDDLYSVFAICEHPSMMYGSDGRINYSAITAENASCVCPFNAEAYPGAIVLATKDELKLALVDEERTTHVQTLPVNETVRRIAYSADLRAFGLGTVKRSLQNSYEVIESHFKLVDEVAFQELDTYGLKEEELVECCIRASLPYGSGEHADCFVVGTSSMDEESEDNMRGRILVFEVTEERKLKLKSETSVKGACRCLAMCEGRIVAALIKTVSFKCAVCETCSNTIQVVVYSFEYETGSTPYLDKKASYRMSTAPIDMTVTGDVIAVADLMKSISLLQFKKGRGGTPDSLDEVARHYETSWATAVAKIDDTTYLEADAEGNLMVLNHEVNGFSEEDKRRLRVTSDILLGEMVNRIRRIDVQPTPGAIVIPRAFIATVEGSIWLFALISPSKQDLLMRLQANMASMVQSPGHVPFNKYRAFKTTVRESDEPTRFVDGELIERFLDCDSALQEKIVEGLDADVEDVRSMVEMLKRLH